MKNIYPQPSRVAREARKNGLADEIERKFEPGDVLYLRSACLEFLSVSRETGIVRGRLISGGGLSFATIGGISIWDAYDFLKNATKTPTSEALAAALCNEGSKPL